MIKQQAFEERDVDQYLMQDTYQPRVFNGKMEVKLAKTLSIIKEKYCENVETVKASKKESQNIMFETSNKCQIGFGERPRKMLLNINDEEQEPSEDLEMSQLTIEFINEHKEYTPNLSAEQRRNIRQNVKQFLDQRKLGESHCRKILTQLSKERFINGVYFKDMIFDLSRQGMMADVEQQLSLQLRTLRQHHEKEEAMLLQQMPANIYFDYLGATIEKQYFPAYDPSSREKNMTKDKGDSQEKFKKYTSETNQSPFDLIPFKNLPQIYPVLFTESLVKIEDQYDA